MTAVAEESATDEHSDGTRRRFALNGGVRGFVLTSLLLLLIYASAQSDQLGRLYSVSWKIVLVVGTSAAVFIGANLLISQGRQNWARYRALAGGLLGATGFGLLRGNRSISTLVADSEFIFTRDDSEPLVVVDPAQIDAISTVTELRSGLAEYATGGFVSLGTVEWPLVGLMLGLVAGYATGHANRIIRLAVPTAVGAFAGWLIGTSLLFRNRPDASIVEIVLFAIVAPPSCGNLLLFGNATCSSNAACSAQRSGPPSAAGCFPTSAPARFHGDHRRRHPTCAARSAIRLAERPRRDGLASFDRRSVR